MNEFSLYIHIPFCISKCAYCDFFSIPCNKSIPDEYVNSVCNEILVRSKKVSQKKCKSVFIGGGTPSLLTFEQLEKIINSIKRNFDFRNGFEFTMEVNPDDITKEFLNYIQKAGVTRLSVGIQSLDENVLSFVKRRAGQKENINALDLIKQNWNGLLNIDLISGLPLEKTQSFQENLLKIISYKPEHISLYSLCVEEETPLGKQILSSKIDYDFDDSDSMWLLGKNILLQNGYNQYEVSNFCRNGYECVHNLTYWHHQDYLGIGSGGTGTLYNKDGSGIRWTNVSDIKKYINLWNIPGNTVFYECFSDEKFGLIEKIDLNTSIFEFFMMGMRLSEGINKNYFSSIFNTELPQKFIDLMNKWKQKGLAEISESNYRLNKEGLIFLNRFLEELDL